jgi:hypothetical protein
MIKKEEIDLEHIFKHYLKKIKIFLIQQYIGMGWL